MANVRKPYPRSSSSMRAMEVGKELLPVTIPAVDPNDPDGVVPIIHLQSALKVQVPAWSPTPIVDDPLHTLQLREFSEGVDRLLVEKTIGPPPPAIPDFYELEITRDVLRRSTRTAWLYYTVTNNAGTTESQRRQILIDLERPTFLNPADTVRFVVPPVPAVNEAYLTANPRVAFYIPSYSVMAKGDRVEFFLSNWPNAPVAAADGGELVNLSTTPTTATLAAAAFRKLSSGNAYVRIRIYDATGNYSDLSADLGFHVAFAGSVMPGTLPAPKLVTTVNAKDYMTCSSKPAVVDGVFWLIAPHTDIQAGDLIKSFWQGYESNAWDGPLANTVVEQSTEWAPEHQVKGMPIVVNSFDKALFPLRRFGSATLRYEVWRQGALWRSSREGLARVDLTYPTGGYCSPRGVVFDT